MTTSRYQTHNDYAGEIVRVDRFRVIVGKYNWVIQKQRTSSNSKHGQTWSGVSSPWNRHSLIAAWKRETGLPVPEVVMALPQRFSQFKPT